jgi:hypothetical protein|nr:MAG TPA: hypothetical protein [Caudoviricetes sp.]
MSKYGFKAYDRTSEIYFTQYNNQYVLTKPVSKSIEYVRQIDLSVPYNKQYYEFLLPAEVIHFFRENNLKFAFIPMCGYFGDSNKCLYTALINYYDLYKELDRWDGRSHITFKVYIRPRNLTVYAQIIRRLTERDDRNMSANINIRVLVGFR